MPLAEATSLAPRADFRPRVIVAGFGLPGRSIGDALEAAHVPYTVIEVNTDVVQRCERVGRHMVCGDVRDPVVLREAGIDAAEVIALMMPVEAAVLDAITAIRRLRSDIRIVARASFTSTGMEAVKRGADEIIVAEQVVASAAAHAVTGMLHVHDARS